MRAYNNSDEIKQKYVKRMADHIAADELIRGTGWSDGKGCAVGCTLDDYDHDQFADEIAPAWLAHVEDTLFEKMSFEKSKTFPLLFLQAIKPGADLDTIKGPFLIYVLEQALTTFDHKKSPLAAEAIRSVIALWQSPDAGSQGWKTALAAEAAAEAAARAAREAAVEAAAWAAWAAARAAAAWAAEAARAAWAAARAAAAAEAATAAEAAAAEAAKENAYNAMADELLRLIGECLPVDEAGRLD